MILTEEEKDAHFRIVGLTNKSQSIVLHKTLDKGDAELKRKELIKENYYSKIRIIGPTQVRTNEPQNNKKSKRTKYKKLSLDKFPDKISFNDKIIDDNLYDLFKIKDSKKKKIKVIDSVKFLDIKNIDTNISDRILLLNNISLESWVKAKFYSSKIPQPENNFRDLLKKLNIKYIIHPIIGVHFDNFIIPDFILIFNENIFVVELDNKEHNKKVVKDNKRDKFLRNNGFKVIRIKYYDLRGIEESSLLELLKSNTC